MTQAVRASGGVFLCASAGSITSISREKHLAAGEKKTPSAVKNESLARGGVRFNWRCSRLERLSEMSVAAADFSPV